MPREWGLAVASLLSLGCAGVSDSVCFFDEPCADGGTADAGRRDAGADAGLDGGSTGDDAGPADAGMNPDAGADAGASPGDGGLTAITISGSAGWAEAWSAVQPELEAYGVAPGAPAFSVVPVSLPDAGPLPAGCPRWFGGAVALADARVLALPACAPRFAVIDVVAGTARWIGPSYAPLHLVGGVLGCDEKVYALSSEGLGVMRVGHDGDGGFDLTLLPLRNGLVPGARGFALSRPCAEGMRAAAVGTGGLYQLDFYLEAVVVSGPLGGQTGRFDSITRVDTATLLATGEEAGGLARVARIDGRTGAAVVYTGTLSSTRPSGLATLGSTLALQVTPDGGSGTVRADGAVALAPGPLVEGLRWPTNLLDGWVVAIGSSLVAYPTPALDAGPVELLPALPPGETSGGLVLATNGALVSVPAAAPEPTITIFARAGAVEPPVQLVLSPFFNKL